MLGRIDIITTTLGKALGGASGGCVSGRRELVEMCRQRARPYLFSNTVAPVIVAGALKVLDLISGTTERRDKLEWNTQYWRKLLTEAGFDIKPGESPIVPVMLYNAKLAQDVARDLFAEGIYVVGFFFPVVPKGQARIRTQLSAAHEKHHLDQAHRGLQEGRRQVRHPRPEQAADHREVRAVTRFGHRRPRLPAGAVRFGTGRPRSLHVAPADRRHHAPGRGEVSALRPPLASQLAP